MDSQLIAILVSTAVVIAGTFVLKKVFSFAIRLAGLLAVGFLGRRADVGANGFDWVGGQDLVIIVSSAFLGFVTGLVLNFLVFREDGFGRHFFTPMIAIGVTYLAAVLMAL